MVYQNYLAMVMADDDYPTMQFISLIESLGSGNCWRCPPHLACLTISITAATRLSDADAKEIGAICKLRRNLACNLAVGSQRNFSRSDEES